MKELSIEEKAKAYDEAIERAEKALEVLGTDKCEGARQIFSLFPELAESEDEKIRKWLISQLKIKSDNTNSDLNIMIDKALAWLEKQGEIDMKPYKEAEDEKREFVGDGFIKCYADFQDFKEGETYWLEYVGNDNYNVRSDNLLGKTYHITPCQLYTIFKKQTWLEKQGEQNPVAKMSVSDELYEHIRNTCACIDDTISCNSIKDMKDYLAQARTDANIALDMVKQKPADTVELKCEESKTKVFDAPTPFEDKLYAFVLACEILVDPSKREFILEHSQEILDAAREQIGKEQSSAWSKEDERLLNNMIIVIKDYYNDKDAQSLISWLKSLKPQSQWKPSEEQIRPLEYAIDYFKKKNNDTVYLESLYNDLKNLK